MRPPKQKKKVCLPTGTEWRSKNESVGIKALLRREDGAVSLRAKLPEALMTGKQKQVDVIRCYEAVYFGTSAFIHWVNLEEPANQCHLFSAAPKANMHRAAHVIPPPVGGFVAEAWTLISSSSSSRGDPPSLPKGVDALGGNLLWPRGACLSPGKNSSRAKQKIKCGLRLERDLDSACVLPRWTSSVHFGFAPPVMVSPLIAFHRPLTCT